MTDDLTAELSATSKSESQINSTEELSDCLARLNELEISSSEQCENITAKFAVLANKLHEARKAEQSRNAELSAENERLKAMLGKAREGLYKISGERAPNCNAPSSAARIAAPILWELHAAGIGGEHG